MDSLSRDHALSASSALEDIAAERRRQIDERGYTTDFDERYDDGELASAAGLYAMFSRPGGFEQAQRFAAGKSAPAGWPWLAKYFRPTSPRRMLVKAGALILAEIERMDRLSSAKQTPDAVPGMNPK